MDASLKIPPNVHLQLAQSRMSVGAGATARQMILDFRFHAGIQLAVKIGLDQHPGRCAFHLGYDLVNSRRGQNIPGNPE